LARTPMLLEAVLLVIPIDQYPPPGWAIIIFAS
jgi:hypothetical protein